MQAFPKFNQLPPELRDIIWQHAVPVLVHDLADAIIPLWAIRLVRGDTAPQSGIEYVDSVLISWTLNYAHSLMIQQRILGYSHTPDRFQDVKPLILYSTENPRFQNPADLALLES